MLNFPLGICRIIPSMTVKRFTSSTQLSVLISTVLLGVGCCQTALAQFEPLNCEDATKFVEKTICTNPKLSSLNSELETQLDHAELVTKVSIPVLTLSQKNWIKQRNQCKNTACIETGYKTRLMELKNLNALNQDFVQYLVRVKQQQPDQEFSLLQLQNLDEKRLRVVAQTFWNSSDNQQGQVLNFSGYANQGKKITVRDLDTQCVLTLKLHQNKKQNQHHQGQWEVRQASPMCGNKHLRFSGFYEVQK